MSYTFRVAAALALAAMGAAVPAQAACWGEQEASAAHVRQLQTMLMVATLRCRAAGIDLSADYDRFVVAQGDAIVDANLAVRRHFPAGPEGDAAFDRFTTSLANGYGDDATTLESCAAATALAHDGATAAAAAALDGMAMARATPVALPEGRCPAPRPLVMAAATPPPFLALAAPEALPPRTAGPATLPADVVTALAVLARFQASLAAPTPAPAPAPVQMAAVMAR